MADRRFYRKEPQEKTVLCRCGKIAKLVKRRNFPHGRKAGGRTSISYKCSSCNNQFPSIKPREVKK